MGSRVSRGNHALGAKSLMDKLHKALFCANEAAALRPYLEEGSVLARPTVENPAENFTKFLSLPFLWADAARMRQGFARKRKPSPRNLRARRIQWR